jgi:tripartite-type tricarboxylate transporter receptor subunit TctC
MMMARSDRLLPPLALVASAWCVFVPGDAWCQPADPFFKGKIINLYIGFAPGGSYDYYARQLARFMGRHIAGNPTIVAQTMPGGGSFQAANFLYALAPRDGTAMGTVSETIAIDDAMHSPGVQFKAAEFNWIGRLSAVIEVTFTWKTSKAKTIDDARHHEIPVAGTGPGSPSEGFPKLLNAFTGTRFKIISGYPGSNQGMMAMERGEVDGGFTSWNTLKRTKQEWIANHDINLLVQYALERSPDLSDVPNVVETGLTPEGREALAFFASGGAVGRSIIAPPGMPAERVTILRRAFDATLKDPDFVAEIEKSGSEFQPAPGEALQKIAVDTANAPRAVIERTEAVLRGH